MANPEWSYLQNPFDNATKGSAKRMYIMATDHFDKLEKQAQGQPAIAGLLETARPYYEAFAEQYKKSSTDSANYQMRTMTMEHLFIELRGQLIRRWDILVQTRHDIKSPEYKSLLPSGRKPFQSGAYDLRIDQTYSLADRLSKFPGFSDMEEEVRAFADKLREARMEQQGMESIHQTNSSDLENKRKSLAVAMHRVFAGLLAIYIEDLPKVETFYELKYLRRHRRRSNGDNLAGKMPEGMP